MENIDKADLLVHLESVGFQKVDEQPEIMEYYHEGELILHVILDGGNIISLENHQKMQIATQAKLTAEEFDKLSIGKLTEKLYKKILDKQGMF